jgi:hypothetical protein
MARTTGPLTQVPDEGRELVRDCCPSGAGSAWSGVTSWEHPSVHRPKADRDGFREGPSRQCGGAAVWASVIRAASPHRAAGRRGRAWRTQGRPPASRPGFARAAALLASWTARNQAAAPRRAINPISVEWRTLLVRGRAVRLVSPTKPAARIRPPTGSPMEALVLLKRVVDSEAQTWVKAALSGGSRTVTRVAGHAAKATPLKNMPAATLDRVEAKGGARANGDRRHCVRGKLLTSWSPAKAPSLTG